MGMRHINADPAFREKSKRKLYKNTTSNIEQILNATSHWIASV